MMGNEWCYTAILVSCFIGAFLVEALSVFQNRIEAKNKLAVTLTGQPQHSLRFVSALTGMVRLFFAYMLMIGAMTFNALIVVFIVLGFTFGYLCLGFEEVRLDLHNNKETNGYQQVPNRLS